MRGSTILPHIHDNSFLLSELEPIELGFNLYNNRTVKDAGFDTVVCIEHTNLIVGYRY